MPTPPLSFSHVGLFVRDMAVMEDFYARVLGFRVTDRGFLGPVRLTFLSRDPDEHHQIVLVAGRPQERHFNIINQISFRAAALDDLRHFHSAFANEAVTDIQPVTHGNSWSLYFRDPEGNRLEIFVDTPWYVLQPLREPIDLSLPDEVIEADTLRLCQALPDFMSEHERRDRMVALMNGSDGE